jgi:hypothetical protein
MKATQNAHDGNMGSHRKQHYGSRSYLRAWSPDGRRIWMFDKVTAQRRFVGIGSVAQEPLFNDSFRKTNSVAFDGLRNDLFERQFQTFENDFLVARDVAHAVAANERPGTLAERQTMSLCAAVQLLRTAATRDAILSEATSPHESQPLRLISWLRSDLQRRILADPTFAKELIALIQASLIWNTTIVPAIATELFHYLWVIARNDTTLSFCTSDAPIAALVHDADAPPFYPHPRATATGSPALPIVKSLFCEQPDRVGLELIFPVSPRCALLMFHPHDFADSLGERQGNVLVVGAATVLIRNGAIAGCARRQVFGMTEEDLL